MFFFPLFFKKLKMSADMNIILGLILFRASPITISPHAQISHSIANRKTPLQVMLIIVTGTLVSAQNPGLYQPP